MRNLLAILVLLFSQITFSSDDNKKEDQLKACLAAIYTAEKAYHSEYDSYSDDFLKIGFVMDHCDLLEFQIESTKDDFLATALDLNGKWLGSIDSDKTMLIN